MARLLFTFAVLTSVTLCGSVLPCSLCGPGARSTDTLRQEMERAKIVVYGKVANPRFAQGGVPGAGITDLHIERVLKHDPFIADKKTIQLERYLPIIDAKDPPRFIVFCDLARDRLDAYHGRQVRSAAVLDYLDGAKAYQGKSRVEALQYYFRFVDHADETVAEDAFLEFARSTDAEVGQVSQKLDVAKLRALVQNPKIKEDRLSLFAFLLGACGKDREAKLLRSMIDQADDRSREALDGLLAGYISLQPREGWQLASKILNDSRQPFKQRFAVVRTLRFAYGWKPAETRPHVLRCYGELLQDGSLADVPLDDLRRWKLWELTDKVLPLYGRPTHDAPILRGNIVRYALCCPLPQARDFVTQIARQNPALVQELREALDLEEEWRK